MLRLVILLTCTAVVLPATPTLEQVAASLRGEGGLLLETENVGALALGSDPAPAACAGAILYLLAANNVEAAQKLAAQALARFPDTPIVLEAVFCCQTRTGNTQRDILDKLATLRSEDYVTAVLRIAIGDHNGDQLVGLLRAALAKKPVGFSPREFAAAMGSLFKKAGWGDTEANFYALHLLEPYYLQTFTKLSQVVVNRATAALGVQNYDLAINLYDVQAASARVIVNAEDRTFAERILAAQILSNALTALANCYTQKQDAMASARFSREANDVTLLVRRLTELSQRSRFFAAGTAVLSPERARDYVQAFYQAGESAAVDVLLERRFPDAPRLLSPPDMLRTTNRTLLFRWKRVQGTTHYEISVAAEPEFKEVILSKKTPADAVSLKFSNDEKLWWRVRAFTVEKPGEWSETRSFETQRSLTASIK